MKKKTYKNNKSKILKALAMFAILIFIPVITLSSCNQTSVDDMLEEYNEAYDPNFGNQ